MTRRFDPPEVRWRRKVQMQENGCWVWTGAASGGYGYFRAGGRTVLVHRWAYEHFVGPIPDGLTIDHVKSRGCTTTLCCNPAHLEPVTQKENVLRGTAPSAAHARQTHCINGHEFTPENTYRHGSGRKCRACTIERASR